MSTIPERVSAGIQKLDEIEPGWDEKIDLELLDMQICTDCIPGQVFGRFYGSPIPPEDREDLGFDVRFREDSGYATEEDDATERRLVVAEFVALGAEWIRRILERREAKCQS